VGADADISVFDAEHVIDKATFENAVQYSEGFRYVLVEGSFVATRLRCILAAMDRRWPDIRAIARPREKSGFDESPESSLTKFVR
jgi:hypothetical protein